MVNDKIRTLRCVMLISLFLLISLFIESSSNETKGQESYISNLRHSDKTQGNPIANNNFGQIFRTLILMEYDIDGSLRVLGRNAKCFYTSMFYLNVIMVISFFIVRKVQISSNISYKLINFPAEQKGQFKFLSNAY